MKRIVALLLPVEDSTSEDASGSLPERAVPAVRRLSAAGGRFPGAGFPENLEGAFQIEAVLSDEQAQRLVDGLLQGDETVPCSSIAELLHAQLDLAGGNAEDLLERIVGTIERELVELVYESCGRVKTEAARRLGIHRNTLDKKLRLYRIDTSHSD